MTTTEKKVSSWMPVAGDVVRTKLPHLKAQYRIKSIVRRSKQAYIYVPTGVDEDGDTVFSDVMVSWSDIELVGDRR